MTWPRFGPTASSSDSRSGSRSTVSEAPTDAAYFPIECVLSVVTRMEDGSLVEVATIGREGTTAVPLIVGANTTANDSFCQVEGRATENGTFQVAFVRRKVCENARFRIYRKGGGLLYIFARGIAP